MQQVLSYDYNYLFYTSSPPSLPCPGRLILWIVSSTAPCSLASVGIQTAGDPSRRDRRRGRDTSVSSLLPPPVWCRVSHSRCVPWPLPLPLRSSSYNTDPSSPSLQSQAWLAGLWVLPALLCSLTLPLLSSLFVNLFQ